MRLIIMDFLSLQHVPVQKFLKLDQCGCLMAAYISQIIRAAATDRKCLCIPEFLNKNLIIGGITVILDPEGYGFEKLIILNKLHVSYGVNLLTPADNFIGSICINVFNKVREGHSACLFSTCLNRVNSVRKRLICK